MESGDAAAETTYTIESGGWLEVLPEPLVLHAGSRFFQGTRIRVEAGAAAFIAEMVLPGRLARGEYAAWDRLRLRTALESQGRVVLRESLDLTGPEFAELARVCGGSAQAAFGTALLVEPTPGNARPSWLDAVDRLHREGNWIGASRIAPEGWVFKFVSPDGEHLRRQLAGLRNALVEAYPWLRCDPRTRTTSQIQIPPPAPSAHR
jgi:urease accessory protein